MTTEQFGLRNEKVDGLDDVTRFQSFLKLGYFIDYRTKAYPVDLARVNREKYRGLAKPELLELGKEAFRKAIEDNFESHRRHVVPLSGGLDSRALLGGLLECTEAENIETYTFGTPGTYDFELGRQVARWAGTRHRDISLRQHPYRLDELIETASKVDYQCVLFHHPPLRTMEALFGDAVIWSGYIGDAIAGGFLPENPRTLDEVKRNYLHKNRYVRSLKLDYLDDDLLVKHISGGDYPREVMSFEEQILYEERVMKFTAPHVLMKGWDYRTPFINNSWMDLLLGMEDCHRRNQALYKTILRELYPTLFALPTKNDLGFSLDVDKRRRFVRKATLKLKRGLNRLYPVFSNPMLNYIDFEEGFRSRADLKQLGYASLMDLKSREVLENIDFDGIWRRHQRRLGNHADALIALTSLEIILKAREVAR